MQEHATKDFILSQFADQTCLTPVIKICALLKYGMPYNGGADKVFSSQVPAFEMPLLGEKVGSSLRPCSQNMA